MMTLYLFSSVNPDGATATNLTAVHNVAGMKVPKDRFFMVVLNGCHRQSSVKILREGDGMKWAAQPLRMLCALKIGGKPISSAEALEPGKIASIATAVVRHEASFTGCIQSLLSYAQRFEEEYG